VLASAALFLHGVSASAATLPAGFVETLVASGMSSPTAMAFAPDGRIFVCQQGGALRVIRNGVLLAAPFVTVTVDSSGERGLLGVAFHPNFPSSPFVYVYYTATTPTIHNRISRFTANGDVAAPGSEQIILELDNLSGATNHNGGAIHFGPDGMLYAAVGENAHAPNAQTLANLLGKILRLHPDGSIPTDNPFYSQASGNNRAIWALGLRNPFTFAFNADGSRMFVNDVGAGSWEEINDGIAGSNYGWPLFEGSDGGNPSYRDPLLAYAHGSTTSTGCAIVGGAFYDASIGQYPADYAGDYFYADLCQGWIRRFDPVTSTSTLFATGVAVPVDLAIGPNGDLYYLARGGGALYRASVESIFSDNFESGTLAAWSAASTDGGDLDASASAALASTTAGLEAIVDDQTPIFVEDRTPSDEFRYRLRFYFDPNAFDPGLASDHFRVRLFIAHDDGPAKRVVTVVLRRLGGQFSLMARTLRNDGTRADTGFHNIGDAPVIIEIDWQRATQGSANGLLQLWINNVSVATLNGLTNHLYNVDRGRLGALGPKAGAAGILYFDELQSRRRTFIGP
jgi:glucose/arabinose dehydrogenase